MMKNIISVEQNRYQPFFLALNQRCTGGSGLLNAIFFTLRESRRTPDPALPRVRSRLTTASPLVALALKPSDFCNYGVAPP